MSEIISTKNAPGAIGPYSQAVKAGDFVFASGQIPINPATGEIPEGIEAQTTQVLTNAKNLMEAAGASMDKVIKTTVYITDMNNFAKMNEIYANYFKEGSYPARTTVEVSRLPKDVLLEIECIASLK